MDDFGVTLHLGAMFAIPLTLVALASGLVAAICGARMPARSAPLAAFVCTLFGSRILLGQSAITEAILGAAVAPMASIA